eukprot:CAMPEP_0118672084 /NCGR_PEP_ID=MMETSP0785-20121206/22350_1 /TAXON_ID=91992 /ORGANISM="Bolidomonas pacifica, Strain CCMP 1866" /LENGTH=399 /DNA_ID=CAMNT_0006567019 /DNA_START=34 /DNA_END=1230 /DNA_ORIENTATION=-
MDVETATAHLNPPEVKRNTSAKISLSKRGLIMIIGVVAVAGCICGTIIGAAGTRRIIVRDIPRKETSVSSAPLTPPIPAASSSTGFCWDCANGKRDSWWWGWGACECEKGWGGSCCDVRDISIDDRWLGFLANPPQKSITIAETLEAKAQDLVTNLLVSNPSVPMSVDLRDIDVVVSGGGNYDAFYLGVQMVFSRIRPMSTIGISRYAGTSAGGMMPFEVALRGERDTLLSHLSWGVITEEYPEYFSNAVSAAYQQDHGWRLLADFQAERYSSELSKLDDKVFLGTSCLKPWPTLVMISEYEEETAAAAFMSTGTFLQYYDGMVCSDGGATAGPNMTPLFQDNLRDQLIVDLMKTGYPGSMVYSVDLDQYAELIEVGMEEAVKFLKTGTTERDGIITLC